jgi:hypothetical protein
MLEVIIGIFAAAVYGRPDRPRHRIFRYTVRAVALGGGIFLFFWMVIPSDFAIPVLAAGIWAFCGMTVIFAEWEFGRPRIAIASWGVAAFLFSTALYQSL